MSSTSSTPNTAGANTPLAQGRPSAVRFERSQLIRFAHCDPAGIIFFPQYLVLFNQLTEDWFNEGLHVGYADMIVERKVGLPIVNLQCDFRAVSRLGDTVTLGVSVEHLGSRSLRLNFECTSGDELRVRSTQVLVFTDLTTHRSREVPEDIRRAIETFAGLPSP